MINVQITGLKILKDALQKSEAKHHKALTLAMTVEAKRLKKKLKEEIRAGAPGGKRFAPLSMISRYSRRRFRRQNKPLIRLADPIFHKVIRKWPYEAHVGWVGPLPSSNIKDLAKLHQRGFVSSVANWQQRYFLAMGNRIRGGRVRFFRLKKSTTVFRTPARPILAPFWQTHQSEAITQIANNYKRKLRGERI